MGVQGDLFTDHGNITASQLPGLTLWPGLLTAAEERALAAAIDAAPLTPFKFHQWEGKRLTASYGLGYDYDRGRLRQAPPFPPWLRDLASHAAKRAEIDPAAIVQGLVIRYDPGAGIGWHRDKPQFGTVLGLSLSSTTTLRLRRRTETGFERHSLTLPPRSLYRLDGPARWDWEHSIRPGGETRRAVTLRSLAQSGGSTD